MRSFTMALALVFGVSLVGRGDQLWEGVIGGFLLGVFTSVVMDRRDR